MSLKWSFSKFKIAKKSDFVFCGFSVVLILVRFLESRLSFHEVRCCRLKMQSVKMQS
jgi:hypothetical protein